MSFYVNFRGLKLILPGTLLYKKKFILTNRSRVNDPPILAQKQQKMAIFDKTDFWGLKYPLEVRVQHETCSTICGTPVPSILNHKIRPGRQGGPGKVKIWHIWGH